jgi:hypothetical protein
MNAIFWTSGAAILLLGACGALAYAYLQARRESARQRQLLLRQQDQLRAIRKKLYRMNRELQSTAQNAKSMSKAHQALVAQHSAMQETTSHRLRRQLALADTNLGTRVAATNNKRLKLELQEKRNAIRTIMQLLISSRLDAELSGVAQATTPTARHEELVRRRVNEMFPKVLAEPYRKPVSQKG